MDVEDDSFSYSATMSRPKTIRFAAILATDLEQEYHDWRRNRKRTGRQLLEDSHEPTTTSTTYPSMDIFETSSSSTWNTVSYSSYNSSLRDADCYEDDIADDNDTRISRNTSTSSSSSLDDKDEDDDTNSEEDKRTRRQLFYMVGGASLMALLGWASKRVLQLFDRTARDVAEDRDIDLGGNLWGNGNETTTVMADTVQAAATTQGDGGGAAVLFGTQSGNISQASMSQSQVGGFYVGGGGAENPALQRYVV